MHNEPLDVPARPLVVFRDVNIIKRREVAPRQRRSRRVPARALLTYARSDGVVTAVRKARTRLAGVGQHAPLVDVDFEAREKMGRDGAIHRGAWRGRAVGQLRTEGSRLEILTWHYDTSECESTPVPPRRLSVPVNPLAEPTIALVGAGAFARNVIVPALRRAGARIVAVADGSDIAAEALARSIHGDVAVGVPADVLQPGYGFSGVVIACTHSAHSLYAGTSLQSGYRTFVEKPAALSRPELESLVAGARAADVELRVGHNRRFSRYFPILERHAANDDAEIDLSIEAFPLSSLHWYRAPSEGGRLLGNLTHWIDLAIAVTGDDAPDRFRVERRQRDGLSIAFEFSRGRRVDVRYHDVGMRLLPGAERATVRHVEATVEVDDWRTTTIDDGTRRSQTSSRRDRGHDAQYADWVASLRYNRKSTTRLDQLVRSHALTFVVQSALGKNEDGWQRVAELRNDNGDPASP
jgi:predicted dehydrogenase